MKRCTALTRFATDARLEADNNIAENSIRCIALGRKPWLFAGSDCSGQRAAAMHSLIVTAKKNNVDPRAWLADHPRPQYRPATGVELAAASARQRQAV